MSGMAALGVGESNSAHGASGTSGLGDFAAGAPGVWLTSPRRASNPEGFRQMQLNMLSKENADLSSKLDSLTMDLRSRADKRLASEDVPSTRSTSMERGNSFSNLSKALYSRPEKVIKSPKTRELVLHFAGEADNFDRAAISAKLLHLKRLLHRRVDAGLTPPPAAAKSLLHAVCAMHECPVSEQTARIEIVSTRACPPEQQGVLATELAGLLSFTLSATFDERDVSFRLLSADGIAAHARALSPNSSEGAVDVLVVGTNDASDMETRISEDALAEAVKGESASWEAAYGAGVRVAWVRRDADAPDKSEGTVVCSAEERGAATALHYPAHLQAFFAEKSASCAEDARGFMNTVLADTLDGMAFQEWRPEQRGAVAEVLVPVAVPEWAAATLLQLSRDGDLWLSFLTTAPHPLLLITSERPKECADITQGESPSTGPTGATAASIKLFFELERQQELIRRKIASLERLMQCKQFVSHMESFTARLQSHAEELFSGIRIKQETPNTLDALCSQLSSLSMQCEACIDQAMDAVQKVGEAPQGEEFILQQQLTKIVHARSAKRHVDALKNQVEGALAEKRQGSTKALASSPPSGGFAGTSSPAAGARSPAVPRLGSSGQLSIEEGERSAAYSADRRAVLEMLDNIEKGLQVHKEQQEQLVDFWLKQHAIVKSELDSLKKMATDALTAEDIGVEELHGRFQKYCEFLEEHEHVEDKMLFPLVKSLFPQSAQALDSVLDPERHKGVDMLNAKVGRLLQQLHDRHRAGEEMVLNTQEMGKVVEALERLNDYMVGHIRYEEEMTMPWFEGFEQTPALRPLAIS